MPTNITRRPQGRPGRNGQPDRRPEHTERIARLKTRNTELRAQTGDVDLPGYVAPKLEPGKRPA